MFIVAKYIHTILFYYLFLKLYIAVSLFSVRKALVFIVTGRRAKKQAQKASSKIPDLRDHELVQKFFLQEVKLTALLLEYVYIILILKFTIYHIVCDLGSTWRRNACLWRDRGWN